MPCRPKTGYNIACSDVRTCDPATLFDLMSEIFAVVVFFVFEIWLVMPDANVALHAETGKLAIPVGRIGVNVDLFHDGFEEVVRLLRALLRLWAQDEIDGAGGVGAALRADIVLGIVGRRWARV
jgi:hypothetical protein